MQIDNRPNHFSKTLYGAKEVISTAGTAVRETKSPKKVGKKSDSKLGMNEMTNASKSMKISKSKPPGKEDVTPIKGS